MSLVLKTDYQDDPQASERLASYLDRDNQRIMDALNGNAAGGGAGYSGAGRLIGADETIGRAVADPGTLFLMVPNDTYRFQTEAGYEDVELDEPGGFTLIEVPAGMSSGKYAYASKATGGGIEVLPASWSDALLEDTTGLVNLGLVKSNSSEITSIDYTYTDEVQTNAQLVAEIRNLRAQLDAVQAPEGVIGRGDLIPWDGVTGAQSIKATTTQLLLDLEGRLKDYADGRKDKVMQMPQDALIEAIYRTRAALIRISPEAADLVEAAELVVGFAGHAPDGSEPPALGINGTNNVLLHTTLQVNTFARQLEP